MPIYEFACPKCRVIFNFLSKRINPNRPPVCPKCGNKKMEKQMSTFALSRGSKSEDDSTDSENGELAGMPDIDDPKIARAMNEMERDMADMDENNPRHMAQMMRKMQEIMPPGSMPKEMESTIKRLEAGEDPEKIEEDMGDIFENFMGGEESETHGGNGRYSRDSQLYDY